MHVLEVDGEEGILSLGGFAEVILRNLRRLHGTTGTVHEDVDVAVVCEDLFAGRDQALPVEHICRHGHGFAAICRNVRYDLLSVLLTSAEHGYLRTARCQCAGIHAADDTGAAGHHGHLSAEINLKWYVHRFFLLPLSVKIMNLLSLCTSCSKMSSVKLLTGLLYAFSYFLQSSRSLFGRLEKASFTGKRPQKKTAPRICLLQQIHGAIIYRGYQIQEISTVMMQASIQTPSGIQMMYHDTAYHDAGHGYEEIL